MQDAHVAQGGQIELVIEVRQGVSFATSSGLCPPKVAMATEGGCRIVAIRRSPKPITGVRFPPPVREDSPIPGCFFARWLVLG